MNEQNEEPMDISTLTICPRCKGREEIQCHLADHGWTSCPDCSDGLPYAELNLGVSKGPWKYSVNWQCPGSLKGGIISYFDSHISVSPRLADVSSMGVASQEICDKNGRLLASSKDLYNVCAELSEWLEQNRPDVELPYGFEDRLNSALAKAGRSIQ